MISSIPPASALDRVPTQADYDRALKELEGVTLGFHTFDPAWAAGYEPIRLTALLALGLGLPIAEYGMGLSTILFARAGIRVFSTDTDSDYANAVMEWIPLDAFTSAAYSGSVVYPLRTPSIVFWDFGTTVHRPVLHRIADPKRAPYIVVDDWGRDRFLYRLEDCGYHFHQETLPDGYGRTAALFAAAPR